MPLTIPAFSQYQWQVPAPLRGVWNLAPKEGDRFLNAEIDWLVGTVNAALQFQCGGNSPVAMSQIVALYVDNRRCGSDVIFTFPDTQFELVVPAHTQGLFPVLTNALTFFAQGANVAVGDVTILQILNSLPPPIFLLPSAAQAIGANANQNLATGGGTSQIIPAGTNGTLQALTVTAVGNSGATPGQYQLAIVDGAAHTLWNAFLDGVANGSVNLNVNLSNLGWRFFNGLTLQASQITTFASGHVNANVFYVSP